MNTDNMSIAGETIDYGPCAFMDAYNPRAVYSSIDTMGREAMKPRTIRIKSAQNGKAIETKVAA